MGRLPKFAVIDGKKQCSKCGASKPHTSEFFTLSHSKPGSICRDCRNEQNRPYCLDKWRSENSVAVGGNAVWAERQREFYHSPAGKRSYQNTLLKKQFGITLVQYEDRLHQQGGACALCKSPDPGGRGNFHVDHDHQTGVIRGLLCHSCNVGLGLFRDDPSHLWKAIEYLDQHSLAA